MFVHVYEEVPYSWVQSRNTVEHQQQQQQQLAQLYQLQQEQQPLQQTPKKQLSTRRSFHELDSHYQQDEAFRQQYYQQQFLQHHPAQQVESDRDTDYLTRRTPTHGSASPHRSGQSTGLENPMSPTTPVTPSSASRSNESLSVLTHSQGAVRGGNYHVYDFIPPAPASPSNGSHQRKKSFTSGPIPSSIPTDTIPKSATSPYSSPPNIQPNFMSHMSPRRNASSEAISQHNPRDNYRRSESFSTVQARSHHSQRSGDSTTDVAETASQLPSGQEYAMRSGYLPLNSQAPATDPQAPIAQIDIKRESWKDQDHFLLQLQQRDHSKREKHKRESFYAALQSNPDDTVSSGDLQQEEEHRRIFKSLSRTASPLFSSNIPFMRTKSRGTQPTTPTADSKARPTPPPRSRSRTPGGGGITSSQPKAPTPQQPQVPQQYSAEMQPIGRRSVMQVDDAQPSSSRADTLRSASRSTPSTQSGTPTPPSVDTYPVPVADITKHLSGLEFKEQSHMSSTLDVLTPTVHQRQPSSNSMTTSMPVHRRSLVFDLSNSPGRLNGMDQGGQKHRDNAKDRHSMVSNNAQSSSRKRGKTLSAMDPPKEKPSPPILPPMYMSTLSRTTNIPSPMASRMSGSKIPSPSSSAHMGRVGTVTPKESKTFPKNNIGAAQTMATQAPPNQDIKTIRGGGLTADNSAPYGHSAESQGSTKSMVVASPGSSKTKSNRSFSSSVLAGSMNRRSMAMDAAKAGEPLPSSRTPQVEIFGTLQVSRHSITSNQQGTQSDLKRTPTSGLRTPTAVKEMRASPSKPHGKHAAHSGPIQLYHTNQPMPLYGQGLGQSPAHLLHPLPLDSKSPNGTVRTTPVVPLSPYAALKLFGSYLSLYERAEIGEYPQVYYVGQNCHQKKAASMEASNSNFGFDDERGDYLIVNHDHLMFRYEVLDMLGKGSFGQVAKCYDHKTGEYVAIKIIRNKMRFHCQAVVEVKILGCLNKWDPEDKHNMIRMTDNFYFRNHLCIASELLSINLYEFIKSNSFQGFSLGLIKRFCTQLLQTLELLNRHSVVHCDLKPENILLKHPTKSSIKVIDFGSSCLENEKVYTYIQSRFYRSPEVILGMSYNMAIDMWSLGCILAELYTGYPLFPDSAGNPKIVVNSKGKKRKPGSRTLGQSLKCSDVLFLDFISKCLIWDPEKRMKPSEGLQHEWISEIGGANARTVFSPPPSSNEARSGSRRKSSMFANPAMGSKSGRAKINTEDSTKLNISAGLIKAGRVPTISGGGGGAMAGYHDHGHPVMIGGGMQLVGTSLTNQIKPSSHSHSNGNGNHALYSAPMLAPSSMHDQATISATSFDSVNAAASRRLTVGGDIGRISYHGQHQHSEGAHSSGSSQARKNANSMYGANPSSVSLGHSNSAGYSRYLETANFDNSVGVEDISMRSRR
ncbi:hypothetical protein BG004_000579 [Podila humilis]|nr:hypothetical protein BG004_000579 [Podila humilis]